jgi:hypothetical protein
MSPIGRDTMPGEEVPEKKETGATALPSAHSQRKEDI